MLHDQAERRRAQRRGSRVCSHWLLALLRILCCSRIKPSAAALSAERGGARLARGASKDPEQSQQPVAVHPGGL